MISAGAKVLGSFTVGENSKIGAGSVVLTEVPPNSTVVGVPGRVVKRDNVRIPREDMDQVHLPDPVKAEIDTLKQETGRLAATLEAFQEQAAAFQVWQETCNKS
jgi:serine O-acetyltransferase